MDDKLRNTLSKIKTLADKNPEFANELRKIVKVPSPAVSVSYVDNKIDDIYEYCIEKIIRDQAVDFYKDFPYTEIIPELIEDYIRMELFRRRDNFKDFCLALFQQIECITNYTIRSGYLDFVTEEIYSEKINSKSNKSIASTIFFEQDVAEKKSKPIKDQFACDKIYIVIYFAGFYKKDNYIHDFYILKDEVYCLYQVRNMNHRGGEKQKPQQKKITKIMEEQAVYYFKFMGLLAKFVKK